MKIDNTFLAKSMSVLLHYHYGKKIKEIIKKDKKKDSLLVYLSRTLITNSRTPLLKIIHQ